MPGVQSKPNPFAILGLLSLALAGCGSSDGPMAPGGGSGAMGSGTVTGTVMGTAFTTIASAWWIGKPGTGSAPTQIYVSEAALDCPSISTAGWDHLLGAKQLMEFDLAGDAPKKYDIGTDLDASYVKEPYNPSAEAGSVTITETDAGKSIAGSYELTFAGDNVKGTFDAAFCAEGVEP